MAFRERLHNKYPFEYGRLSARRISVLRTVLVGNLDDGLSLGVSLAHVPQRGGEVA
jgi:hypothetical protein